MRFLSNLLSRAPKTPEARETLIRSILDKSLSYHFSLVGYSAIGNSKIESFLVFPENQKDKAIQLVKLFDQQCFETCLSDVKPTSFFKDYTPVTTEESPMASIADYAEKANKLANNAVIVRIPHAADFETKYRDNLKLSPFQARCIKKAYQAGFLTEPKATEEKSKLAEFDSIEVRKVKSTKFGVTQNAPTETSIISSAQGQALVNLVSSHANAPFKAVYYAEGGRAEISSDTFPHPKNIQMANLFDAILLAHKLLQLPPERVANIKLMANNTKQVGFLAK